MKRCSTWDLAEHVAFLSIAVDWFREKILKKKKKGTKLILKNCSKFQCPCDCSTEGKSGRQHDLHLRAGHSCSWLSLDGPSASLVGDFFSCVSLF